MDKLIEQKTIISKHVVNPQRTFHILSKEIQPPFSLNEHELCFRGERIGSAKLKEKISNNKGSIYVVKFEKPYEFYIETGTIHHKARFVAHDISDNYKDQPLEKSMVKRTSSVSLPELKPKSKEVDTSLVIVEELASMKLDVISKEEQQTKALRYAINRLVEGLEYKALKQVLLLVSQLDMESNAQYEKTPNKRQL